MLLKAAGGYNGLTYSGEGEVFPENPILPSDPEGKARVRTMSYMIAYDIHPIINLKVQQYLVDEFGATDEDKLKWYAHWVKLGFTNFDNILHNKETGKFSHGDEPSMADICLYAQMFNAKRFNCDVTPYKKINEICARLDDVEAFAMARPENQPH
mgnify:CR=1 FL=1